MREIKFRLRIDNKIVGYEKWYQGYNNPDDPCSAQPCWLYSIMGDFWNPQYLYHKQKDQYIGLKDKNGKEIYEGDITDKGVIEFQTNLNWDSGGSSHSGFYFKTYNNEGDLEYHYRLDECEIIGNIYENPKL